MKTLPSVLLVGAGRWGMNHLRTWLKLEAQGVCHFLGVTDTNLERLGKLQEEFGVRTFSIDRGIALCDAVDIVVPTYSHFEIAKKALLAGKDVMVEKPVTETLEQALELEKIHQGSSQVFMVGHIFQYNPAVDYVKKAIADGEIGKIRFLRGRFVGYRQKEHDSGILATTSIYFIYLANHLIGKSPLSVRAKADYILDDRLDDFSSIRLDYGSEFCMIESDFFTPGKWRTFDIIGSEGVIFLDALAQRVELHKKKHVNVNGQFLPHEGDTHIPYIQFQEPLVLELEHFVQCIKERRQPITGIREGVEVMKIIEAGYNSSRTDKSISLTNDGLITQKDMKCQICGSSDVYMFLDLGKHPPCDFLTSEQIASEKKYPLEVYNCRNCSLVQIGKPVDQTILFQNNYHHIAALSSSFKKHLGVLAEKTVERFGLTKEDLMVELGSNDGALMEEFRDRAVRVLGVDPSDVAKMANDKGLTTIVDYFDENLSKKMVSEYGKAKIITALNTFAHVTHIDTVMKGIKNLLTDDGVFISENHYVLDLIKGLQYDFIYHEHSRYYSLKSLVQLFGRFGMDVFDIERIPTHNGSIRVFGCKRGAYPISEKMTSLLKEEEEFGLYRQEAFEQFATKVDAHIKSFNKMLTDIKAKGHTIAGLTFPARAVTLLGATNIGPETIDYITELSTIKIGKYTPGSHIKVVDQEILFGDNAPDYGVLLSWHIADEIIPRFRAKGFKGKIIIPLPDPKILD